MRFFKRMASMSLLTIGTVLGSVSGASAAHTALANTCVPVLPTDAAKIAYTAAGVKNTSAGGSIAGVMCYAGTSNVNATTTITVFLVDNNPGVMTACRASATIAANGGVAWSVLQTSNASMSFTVPNLGGQKLLSVECGIPGVSGGNASSIVAILSN